MAGGPPGAAPGDEPLTAGLLAEVHQLLAAYGHAIDACDAEAWVGLFHHDGVSSGPGRPKLRGRDELRAWVEDHPRADLLHTCTNVHVLGWRGDLLDVRSHFVIYAIDTDGTYRVSVAGSYADELCRVDGVLRFWCREATPRRAVQTRH